LVVQEIKMNAIVNYTLNKFCPYIIILFLLFYNTELDPMRAILIIGACIFVDKFAFKAGYSYAYCKKHNINLD
jgi:hypothetical protein